jgi:hypothetical protein
MKGELKFSRAIKALEEHRWQFGMHYYKHRYDKNRTSKTKVAFPKLPLPFIEEGEADQFKGKSVLVLNEQGFGDELMFFRSIYNILPFVKSLAWQCYPETIDLFKLNAPQEVQFFDVRSFDEEYLKQFDCYTSTGNLFAMTQDIKPEPSLYLLTTDEPCIVKEGTVGICWASNIKSPNAKQRTVDVELLKPLVKDEKATSLVLNAPVPDWLLPCPDFKTFLDTARFINTLEIVVTVDTSIAHLAGALGKQTILVLNDHHDWRWRYLDQFQRSLLYPSIMVFELKDLLNVVQQE